MKYYKYDVLNIDTIKFLDIDLSEDFFDSLKIDYIGFNEWFKKKQNSDESVFVYKNHNNNNIEGFLYLKLENKDEVDNSICSAFSTNKILKIGTFKVTKTGYNMGERFLKIIFDHAKINLTNEIYVTIFDNDEEKRKLIKLLEQYGFSKWGMKDKKEIVYVKKMKLVKDNDAIKNYPLVNLEKSRFFLLPIKPEYHTKLLPDCILKTESPTNFKKEPLPWMYALRKVYIGDNLWKEDVKENDIVIFYRTSDGKGSANYRSVMTGIGIILKKERISKNNIKTILRRSVLTEQQIESYKEPHYLEFLFLGNFTKRPNLKFLRENNLFNSEPDWAPRGIHNIDKNIFNKIIDEAKHQLI